MPYIEQHKRDVLDPLIDQLHAELVNLEIDDDMNNMESNLHYLITRLIRKVYERNSKDLTDAIGVLERVKLHHCQTYGVPMQEQDKFDNGDIEPNNNSIQLKEILIETNKEISE